MIWAVLLSVGEDYCCIQNGLLNRIHSHIDEAVLERGDGELHNVVLGIGQHVKPLVVRFTLDSATQPSRRIFKILGHLLRLTRTAIGAHDAEFVLLAIQRRVIWRK